MLPRRACLYRTRLLSSSLILLAFGACDSSDPGAESVANSGAPALYAGFGGAIAGGTAGANQGGGGAGAAGLPGGGSTFALGGSGSGGSTQQGGIGTSSGGNTDFGGASTSGGTGASTSGGRTGRAGSTGTSGGGSSGGSSAQSSGGSQSSGGAQSTSCNIEGSPNPGSGSFTYYYFGQGTWQENGSYVTACGYQGSEPGGQDSDSVGNIANSGYFAAIPGQNSSNFDTSRYCGACAEVSNGGNSVIVTIIDECPMDSNQACAANPSGHLDLSVQAFNALGFSTGNPSGTTWKFVPCPVEGNVVVRIKSGNSNEIYIENVLTPIAKVSMNGQEAQRTSYGAWHFDQDISAGASLSLTDMAGRSITVTVSSTSQNQNQDTNQQFPDCN